MPLLCEQEPYRNVDRQQLLGQPSPHPEQQASPSPAADSIRKSSTSSHDSCCNCFPSRNRLSFWAAAEVLQVRPTAETSFCTPEANRQLEWPSASQTAQQLTAEGVYLDQSRTLHDSEKSICHQAAIIPSTTPGANDSRGAMRAELLKQAELAKAEAFQKAETAVKLVARAQRLARMAKAGASGRLNLQDSTSASSLQHASAEQQHHSETVLVPPSCAPTATCARRVHSKTRAGVAAVAARQAPPPQPQVLPAGHAPSQQQQQQQQRQQMRQQQPQRRRRQQHRVAVLPKRSSSESSTAFSAHRHAHAGTKRSQEAASLPSTDSHHMQFKSQCAEPTLLTNPTGLGSRRRRTAVTWQAAEAATAVASEAVAHQQQKFCQFPAVDSLPLCEAYTEAACLLDSVCQLPTADSQRTCGPDLLAPMHRQSNTGTACNWAAAGASHLNSASTGSTSLLTGVKSEPQLPEEMALHTSSPVHSHFPAQRMERQQHAHPMASESASALRQQHQLHMIDLMLARVSAAEEAIQLGLSQCGPYLDSHDSWAPAESCKMLLDEIKVEASGDAGFSSIESLLLCAQQPQCSLEEMADVHDSPVHMDRSDYMLKGYTDRTHSSSGSSIDCPGRFLVPQDWLIDGNDEVDLAYFSKLPNDDAMLSLPLPLMSPSLQQSAELAEDTAKM
ncbi:hypothetical protein ABBQ38_004454 [Trebouxia sp. C0009 RCD-2024]